MSVYPHATCHAEITVAHRKGEIAFFKHMKYLLEHSSTRETPVTAMSWPKYADISFLSYSGIIIVSSSLLRENIDEDIISVLTMILPRMVENNDASTLTQKLLLCKSNNNSVIDTFCEYYHLNKENLKAKNSELFSFWSVCRQNKVTCYPTFKPSRVLPYEH